MNERIKELYRQAADYAYTDANPNNGWKNGKDFNENVNEKFAELIVLDTIKDCRDMFMVNSISWNLLNEKLEHFGIEE